MSEPDLSELDLLTMVRTLLQGRGPMSTAALAEEFDEDEDVVTDGLYDIADDTIAPLLDDRWVDVPSVLAGRVFTHRLTGVEVAHDVLPVNPDLELILAVPDAGRRLPSGELLDTIFPGMDESDQRDVPHKVRENGGTIPLPVGTLAGLGAGAGDLVGLRVTETGIDIGRVDPDELADPQPVLEALTDVLDPDQPSYIEHALMTVCADSGDAFRTPVLPIADLIATAGLVHEMDDLATPGFDLAGHQEETRRNGLARTYDLSQAEAQATMVLMQASGKRIERGPEEVAAAAVFLTEPAVADALLRTCLVGRDGADGLLGLVDDVWPQAIRQVRPALQWLRAKAYESRGDVLEAEQALQAAERLDPTWPPTLLDLARYAGDRGDAVRGLALLRRAAPYEDPELEAMLEHFRPVAGPVVGRNDPCWCGSGRKFKQCHLHRPAEPPLSERARWLWAKGRRFLKDGRWPYRVDTVLAERIAYAKDGDAFVGGPDDPLISDAVLFEGGAFADFVAVRGDLLPADERMLAEQWLLVHRSLFEVTAVRPGEGLTVRDVRTGDVHDVQERLGSSGLRPGQLICARVVPAGDTMQIFGGMEPVRLHERDDLLALLDSEPEPDELVAFLTRRFAPPTVVFTERARRLLDSNESTAAVDPDDPAVDEAMTAHIADYERKWLDLSIPALRGLTPRQAAADPTRREDLVQLLASFPDTDSPTAMSAGRLREALGLTT